MTKKEQILQTAIELFSARGYSSVSTRYIAEMAGVSESLVFRHYTNKETLIKTILDKGHSHFIQELNRIENLSDSRGQLNALVDLPFELFRDIPLIMRIVVLIRFQNDFHDIDNPLTNRFEITAKRVFQNLGFKEPGQEARLLNTLLTGLMIDMEDMYPSEKSLMMKFLKDKYLK